MIQNLYMGNGCFTKHPFINGCLEFQVYRNFHIDWVWCIWNEIIQFHFHLNWFHFAKGFPLPITSQANQYTTQTLTVIIQHVIRKNNIKSLMNHSNFLLILSVRRSIKHLPQVLRVNTGTSSNSQGRPGRKSPPQSGIFFVWQILSSLKLTAFSHLKIGLLPLKGNEKVFQASIFRCELLVSGRVRYKKPKKGHNIHVLRGPRSWITWHHPWFKLPVNPIGKYTQSSISIHFSKASCETLGGVTRTILEPFQLSTSRVQLNIIHGTKRQLSS